MGNTADSAKFRGLVQALAQSPLKELNETLVKSEWFNSQLDSVEDFLSKFTLIDAKDMIENGNAQFLVDESLSVLYKSKTACWTLTRVLPGFYAYECPLKNPDLIAHSLLTLLTTEGICFETPKENHEIIPWARFDDGDEGKLKDEGHLDINRIECLRLLVVALSEPLFSRGITQGEVSKSINQTGSYEEASEQYHSFLYSLFACVVNEETGIKTWWTNSRKELGIHCLNALCALSDETKENKVYLAFRDLRPDNRSKIFSWLIKTIREENCDGIPALTLFFRLLDGNNGECADDVFSEELASLVLSLSCSIWNNRKNRLKTSSVQLCSVLLLSLSSLRQTGIVLNRTLINEDHHCLPKDFPTISSEWTYVDVLVMTICKFIGDGDHEIYSPLQRLSLTSLTNISWYIKSLTPTSCNSIISLLEACSKPKFVFGGEDHPIYLSSLLEIVNNMLQYQGQGHANLLYAILRSKHIFYSIDQLEVPKDLNENLSFVPTQEWFNNWKTKFGISTSLFAISELSPKILSKIQDNSSEKEILQIISQSTLVGALPTPKPIYISRYARNEKIDSVIRRCFWIHLLRSDDYYDLWQFPAKKIKKEEFTVVMSHLKA